MADIVDKIFSKLEKEQAPQSLKDKIQAIPQYAPGGSFEKVKKMAGGFLPFFQNHRRAFAFSAAAVVLLLVGFSAWQTYFDKPGVPSQFVLEATRTDNGGVSPDTTFILKSSQNLSDAAVKKVLVFNPAVDFTVKRVSSGFSLIRRAFAVAEGTQAVAATYEIKPAGKLDTDKVYQAQINDTDYADREYSWAFQIKAPFQVISTQPGKKATYVPINSGIEIVLNREGILNPDKYFEISPSVAGSFEQHGNTVVFLPKKLAEKTVYTVTVKKGLKVEGSEDVLSDDYKFSFETSSENYAQTSYFDVGNDFVEFIPGKQPSLEVYSYQVDDSKLDATIYKLADISEFWDSYQKSRAWDYGWTQYYRREAGSTYKPKDENKVLSFKPKLVSVDYRNYVEIPQALGEGYYLVDFTYGGQHKQVWLQGSALAHYYSIAGDKGLVWVYNFSDRQPVDGAAVSFLDSDAGGKNIGATSGGGLLQFSTPDAMKKTDGEIKPYFLKLEKTGMLPVLVKIADPWGYMPTTGKGDPYWDYFSTDRYVYKMNDTLRFWGIVKGRAEDVRDKKVQVGIYNQSYWRFDDWGGMAMGDEKPLVSTEAVISSFDTIQGSIPFSGLTPGYYSMTVSSGKDVISTASFQVMAYSKPLYSLAVTTSKASIFAGDSVDYKVKATFFDGTPVSGIKLAYNGYWKDTIQGELTLDQNGEGQVTITPDYQQDNPSVGMYWYYPRSLSLNFYPANSEEGEISGSGSVLVFGPSLYLQSFQNNQSGDKYTFKAKVNKISISQDVVDESGTFRSEYIGDPAANQMVVAEVFKTTYQEIPNGQYYDPIEKVVRTSYRYESKTESIDKLSGLTNNAGEWSFDKTLPADKNSNYYVIFSTTDSRGRTAYSTSYAYYGYYSYYNSGGSGTQPFALTLSFGQEATYKEFSLNDTVSLAAQVMGGTLSKDSKVLFYRYQQSIDEVKVQNDMSLAEKFEKPFLPSVQYRAVVLGPYGFVESNPVTAIFKQSDAELKVDIKPDKDAYRPGDKASIDIQVKDKDGKTPSSEINVAVVDEALFHVLPSEFRPDILSTLYRQVSAYPMTGASDFQSSESLSQSPSKGGAERGGCFVGGTQIMMADGSTKPIEDIQIGDRIMTFADDSHKKLAAAVVQGVSRHFVDEYLVLNDSLEVTAEHKVYFNGKWDYAGMIKTGDIMVGADGEEKIITSVKRVPAIHTAVYNIVVSKYHTYFAGGYYVHNAEKGGSPRANFIDVPVFDSVHTSSDGRASLNFTVPDNITSWRITALAYAPAELQAGEGVKNIVTTIPFFVDSTLNETYLAGDNPNVRLRAYGVALRAGAVEFRVKSPSLGLDKIVPSDGNTGYVALGQLPEGDYEITVSARQDKSEDSVVRKIKVVKNYFRVSQTSSYQLASSLGNIEGNKGGFTTLTFMDEGKGRFYQQLWWDVYSPGLRSDRQAASYWSQKLLAQYFKEAEPADKLDLSSYHKEEGGLALFPYGDPDLELSAKISDLSPEFVYTDQLTKYFTAALTDQKADIHRISMALYGLASLKQPVLIKAQKLKDSKDLDVADRIYVALALAKLGDKENARAMYMAGIRPSLHIQGPEAWFESAPGSLDAVKLTATAGALASYLNLADTAMIWNYLAEHQPKDTLDVLERTLIAKSELAKPVADKTSFSYKTNSRSESVKLEKGQSYSVTLSEDELKSLTFDKVEGNVRLVSFYERSKDPAELVKDSNLSITRQYLVNNKPTLNFADGDVVMVKLYPKISNKAIDGTYQVVDYVPSGLKPITRPYEQGLSSGTSCDYVWYPDQITENAVYFNVSKNFNNNNTTCKDPAIKYYARVVSKGEFNANPAVLQSLKDINSLNVSASDKLEIK